MANRKPQCGFFSQQCQCRSFQFCWREKKTDLVDGEGRGVDVGQPPDVVPSLLAVLVLHVGREVAEDQAVEPPKRRLSLKLVSASRTSF